MLDTHASNSARKSEDFFLNDFYFSFFQINFEEMFTDISYNSVWNENMVGGGFLLNDLDQEWPLQS